MPIQYINPLQSSYVGLDTEYFDRKALEDQKRHDAALQMMFERKKQIGEMETYSPDLMQYAQQQDQQRYDEVIDKHYGALAYGTSDVLGALEDSYQNQAYNVNKIFAEKYKQQEALKDEYGDKAIVYKELDPNKLLTRDDANNITGIADPTTLDYEIYEAPEYAQLVRQQLMPKLKANIESSDLYRTKFAHILEGRRIEELSDDKIRALAYTKEVRDAFKAIAPTLSIDKRDAMRLSDETYIGQNDDAISDFIYGVMVSDKYKATTKDRMNDALFLQQAAFNRQVGHAAEKERKEREAKILRDSEVNVTGTYEDALNKAEEMLTPVIGRDMDLLNRAGGDYNLYKKLKEKQGTGGNVLLDENQYKTYQGALNKVKELREKFPNKFGQKNLQGGLGNFMGGYQMSDEQVLAEYYHDQNQSSSYLDPVWKLADDAFSWYNSDNQLTTNMLSNTNSVMIEENGKKRLLRKEERTPAKIKELLGIKDEKELEQMFSLTAMDGEPGMVANIGNKKLITGLVDEHKRAFDYASNIMSSAKKTSGKYATKTENLYQDVAKGKGNFKYATINYGGQPIIVQYDTRGNTQYINQVLNRLKTASTPEDVKAITNTINQELIGMGEANYPGIWFRQLDIIGQEVKSMLADKESGIVNYTGGRKPDAKVVTKENE